MWFGLCLLAFAIPGFLALTDIDEKYLEKIMAKDLPEGHVLERVKILKLSPFDTHGTVYGSNRTRAELELFFKSGEPLRKSIVIVDIPNDHRAKIISQLGLFEREINVYSHVLPKMEEYLKQFQDDYIHNKMWLKAYDLQQYTRLIIEDVDFLHYYPHKSCKGLNMEHSKVALDALAKFHALGAVLKQKNIIDMTPYDLSIGQKSKDNRAEWTVKVYLEFAKSIRSYWGAEWEPAAKYFEEKSKTIFNELEMLFKRDESKFNTLLSGYFQIDNHYYKYDSAEQKIPVGMKTIIFQNAYHNSPAFDLHMLLYTSLEPELMIDEARRDELVHFYAQKLIEYLKKYGYEKNYTAEEFLEEDRRSEILGLTNAISLLGEVYQKDAHTQVKDEFFIDGANKNDEVHTKGMSHPKFIKVMKGLVTIARKHGVITY